jgi:hypothetical protein
MSKSFSYLLLSLVLFYVNAPRACAQACVTGTASGPVAYSGRSNMTISNLRITTTGSSPCISLSGCSNIIITNCILGPSGGYGIELSGCSNITIGGNSFMNNTSGVLAASCTGGIFVVDNQFANVDGPSPDGHLVQFRNCSGIGNEISYNVAEDVLGVNSNPNDLINIFESSGTAASPILISNNMLRGGGPGGSSGGILVGDEGGSYINVTNNILVNPGQYGIAVPSGTNINIRNNEVYGQEQHFTNVGLYMYMFYPKLTCAYDTVENNQVYFVDSLNRLSSDYIPMNDPGVSCTPIVDTLNNWDASIGPGILPSRLLCPLLMAYYKFNSNWGDSSGGELTATPVNMAFVGQGEDLMAANFNGTSAYLTAASSVWLTPLTERITVSCWIKPVTTSGIQGIAQAQNSDGYDNGWRMLLNGGNYNIRMTTAGGVADFLCGSVTAGAWTLLTMTYDGQWVRGYINGVLADSTALTGNITYSGTSSPMKIGNCNGANYYFSGYMDEFKFYDGNLLDSEVLQYYNASVNLVNNPSPELRAFYYFDDTWNDATGYQLNATDYGATFVCDGEDYSAGFNGSSYLTLPQSLLLNPFSSTLSVAFWIKPSTVSGEQSIAQAENSNGYNNGWRIILNNNTLDGHLVTSEGAVDAYCGCMQAGVWQFVVMTYDGTALRVYVNGALEATTASGGYIVYGSSSLAEIGQCSGVGDLNGRLDLFQFWDGPLSATAVSQLYNTWLPTFQAAPNCVQLTSDVVNSPEQKPNPDSAMTYSVYPNPAYQVVTIQLADPQKSLQPELIQAELFTITGQLLKSQSGHGAALTIDVAGLKAGIYILRVTHSGHVETTKVVIPH